MNAQLTLAAMLPEHLLLAGLVLVLIVEIMGRGTRAALLVAIVAVAAATVVAGSMFANAFSGAPFPGQFSVTPSTSLAKAIVLALTIPVLLMSRDEFAGGEFSALLLSSLYGVCLLISADSFLTMLLGLELMSLPVYALILLAFRRPESAEAALKYLVLGGSATAMFLMGVSLLFGVSGSMDISAFATALSASDLMSRAAVVLIPLAFFLKAAVVPFHAWAPDAYEGASVPVTAYMAAIVKGGVLLAVVRLFAAAPVVSPMSDLLAVFPLISIVWGNLTAMRQPSFRRMIAYSSIAHAGYLFYALLGDGAGRFQAVTFYVLAYGLLNVLAFAALPAHPDDGQRDRLENLKGLYHRDPFAALVIGVAMLSLAGIPPFPGFAAKFLIFRNVLAAGYTTYAVIGLVGSYLGIYFYLRVIQFMFMSADAHATPQHAAPVSHGEAPPVSSLLASARPAAAMPVFARSAALLCLAASILLSVFPGWVLARV